MQIRPANPADFPAILAIFNHAVRTTAAIWLDSPVDLDNRRRWAEGRIAQGYPVLVAEVAGEVAGYASFGDFRAFEGYRLTVEHSVYVDPAFRRRGIARALVAALEAEARRLGKHVMVGGIDGDNDGSLALHAGLGFVEVGRMPEVGTKFGRWLTLVLVQKVLS